MNAMRLAQLLHFRRFSELVVWRTWLFLSSQECLAEEMEEVLDRTLSSSGLAATPKWGHVGDCNCLRTRRVVSFVWCEISWSFHASTSFQQQTDLNENQLLFGLIGRNPVPHADECFPAICVLPEWNQQRPACCSMPLCAQSSVPDAGCQSMQPSMITGRSMGEREMGEGKEEMLVHHFEGSLSERWVVTFHI